MLHRLNILQEAIYKQLGVKGVADKTPPQICMQGWPLWV